MAGAGLLHNDGNTSFGFRFFFYLRFRPHRDSAVAFMTCKLYLYNLA